MIKGGGKSSGYSADLMVCFPSRTHLSLPSKSICGSSNSHSLNRRQNAPHHRRSLSKLAGSGGVRRDDNGGEIAEPTSPKVTCAGQIKVRSSKRGEGDGGSKNWQSVMAEIEKIHRNKSESKFFGIKKDITGLLTCDFDFRCFGAFPPVDVISDDEEEEEDEEDEEEDEDESSGTVFSKYFMVLHEKQNNEECVDEKENAFSNAETAVPPPNALLLMRCRSALVKNWLDLEEKKKFETEEDNENTKKQSGEEEAEEEEEKETVRKKKDLRSLMEEEKKMNLVVMSYDTNYYKLSADIAKETWVVGGIQDPLFRSCSWKK